MPSRPRQILSKKKLHAAWNASRDSTSRPGAKGTDGQQAKSFAANLDANISNLYSELMEGTFGFSKLRPVKYPKSKPGEYRLVCVPTVKDRLVQRALLQYVNSSPRRPAYPASVFGFVPKENRGVQQAVNHACKLRSEYDWVFETDIQSFFDNINRQRLKSQLNRYFRKSSALELFDKLIDTEISFNYGITLDEFDLQKGRGLRQGMPLSPTLSNFALLRFDKALSDRGIQAIRYVDDIIAFAHTKSEAITVGDQIRELLEIEGLSIPSIEESTKTKLAHKSEPVDFLGWSIREIPQQDRYGKFVSKVKCDAISGRIEAYADLGQQVRLKRDLTGTLRLLSQTVNAYKQTYKGAENIDALIASITEATACTKISILEALFGRAAVENLTRDHRAYIGLSDTSAESEF